MFFLNIYLKALKSVKKGEIATSVYNKVNVHLLL